MAAPHLASVPESALGLHPCRALSSAPAAAMIHAREQGVEWKMKTNELFGLALGVAEPWRVAEVAFSEEEAQLDMTLDFPPGTRLACPECACEGCGVYDSSPRTWRHLNFFQHKTFLHARQPRVRCPEHGVKTVEVPWARPHVGFTLLMDAFIVGLVQHGMTPN